MSRTAWQRTAPDFYWKQNDTAPDIAEQLLTGAGTPLDLSGGSVKFMAWFPGDAAVKINATATITDPLLGMVLYSPSSTDTNTVGDLMAEWQVTIGSDVLTFPNSGWQKIRVKDDIAA